MKKNNVVIAIPAILFFGTLWGSIEASFGGWLYSQNVAYPSLYLITLAIGILAASKVFCSFRWSGTAIGAIAMLFKMVNIPFFACHLLAIFLLGFGYDAACLLAGRYITGRARLPMTGLISAYTGRALFAVIITYVVQYQYWTAAGLPKVIDYVVLTGTVSALLGGFATVLGHDIAVRSRAFSQARLRPRFSSALILAASAGAWMYQLVM